ncbi:phosphonate C-P lyase system protein PhnG [Burkholderia cepacia]|uniref:phosphonate C-P lyase system protein PhnG n=1 Tax=Burkholderia cepacia TaxID=292 RepID=UPI002AB6675F|nr:phosphonate C-P lyase system protein PhnG [Burkholderia cepacia]
MRKEFDRTAWISILAAAPLAELEEYWETIPHPKFQWIRQPELGGVMLRGQVGGSGTIFNVGEATVTRSTLQIETGEIGVAYVLGRSMRHSALAAMYDALMQREQSVGGEAVSLFISRLADLSAEEKQKTLTDTYRSKVDFFMYGQEGATR